MLGGLLYWQFVIAEGAHLGARVVVALYDRFAQRYDRVKNFDPQVEADTLALPLTVALAAVEAPRVLDVAGGTGRLARALLPQIAFDGEVTVLDLSRPMLTQGRPHAAPWPRRAHWLQAPAAALPFAAATFDAVACLEALEFLPSARAALAECARVLRPGGVLLVTNRVGFEAWLMPGKTFSRAAFRRLLGELPLEAVEAQRWQVEYDLIWARKK
ncbi:MAG: class I SAM-dependent methyltransferase [Anaerolineales bacterium]|nr:class I SAM-dependent methyltransferase [Anaerolineales bacterium]